MKLKVLVHTADEGGFWAEVPALPGCVSEGETLDEVLVNVREAAQGWLEVSEERQSPPVHGKRDLKAGTQRALMRQAGLTDDDL